MVTIFLIIIEKWVNCCRSNHNITSSLVTQLVCMCDAFFMSNTSEHFPGCPEAAELVAGHVTVCQARTCTVPENSLPCAEQEESCTHQQDKKYWTRIPDSLGRQESRTLWASKKPGLSGPARIPGFLGRQESQAFWAGKGSLDRQESRALWIGKKSQALDWQESPLSMAGQKRIVIHLVAGALGNCDEHHTLAP